MVLMTIKGGGGDCVTSTGQPPYPRYTSYCRWPTLLVVLLTVLPAVLCHGTRNILKVNFYRFFCFFFGRGEGGSRKFPTLYFIILLKVRGLNNLTRRGGGARQVLRIESDMFIFRFKTVHFIIY